MKPGAGIAREARKAVRLSQTAFAKLLGVDQARIAKWENGTVCPTATALRLLRIIRLDPDKVIELLESLEPVASTA